MSKNESNKLYYSVSDEFKKDNSKVDIKIDATYELLDTGLPVSDPITVKIGTDDYRIRLRMLSIHTIRQIDIEANKNMHREYGDLPEFMYLSQDGIDFLDREKELRYVQASMIMPDSNAPAFKLEALKRKLTGNQHYEIVQKWLQWQNSQTDNTDLSDIDFELLVDAIKKKEESILISYDSISLRSCITTLINRLETSEKKNLKPSSI